MMQEQHSRQVVLVAPGTEVVVGTKSDGTQVVASCSSETRTAIQEPQTFEEYARSYLPYAPYAIGLCALVVVFGTLRSYGEKPAPKPIHSGIEEYDEDADADDTEA